MTKNRNKKRDREETLKLIMDPNRRKFTGGENWLGHGVRGGKDAFVDDMLLDGATMPELLTQRGAIYEHLSHLRDEHGLEYEKFGEFYRYSRSELGISAYDVQGEIVQPAPSSKNLNNPAFQSQSPNKQSLITINKQDVESLFSTGDLVQSGGGRSYFRITEILVDRIRIKPTESSTSSRLYFQKIATVINNINIIDPNRIEKSVYELLLRCNQKDTQNESYLYGFAKEFLARAQDKTEEPESEDSKNSAIKRMAKTARDTVDAANGQQVSRTVKNKELRFPTLQDLEKYISELITTQGGLCAISGLALQFDEQPEDQELICSLDRIDSNGHYEAGNLQVVCRFVNRWKNDGDDIEFRSRFSTTLATVKTHPGTRAN